MYLFIFHDTTYTQALFSPFVCLVAVLRMVPSKLNIIGHSRGAFVVVVDACIMLMLVLHILIWLVSCQKLHTNDCIQ